jgi:DNA replication licensing factor MCM6
MSSLVDAVLQSDQVPEEARSDAPPRRRQARSSSRPRGPPSISTPGVQSDIDGYADDEVVDARAIRQSRTPGDREIPRVVDTTAETLGIQFERFLEK